MTAMRQTTSIRIAMLSLATAAALAAPARAEPILPSDGTPTLASLAIALPLPAAAIAEAAVTLTPTSTAALHLPGDTSGTVIPALAKPALSLRPLPMQRPVARDPWLPAAQWDDRADAAIWTRATLAAVRAAGLTEIVPHDIATWCPEYERADEQARAAFWVGLFSALSRYESTHNPRAVGGGGLYFGLLQILPSTARQYGCLARNGEALRDPEDNLACAVRIAAVNVLRDNAVARFDGRNAGLARDWGPMTVAGHRDTMADWTRTQAYCTAPSVMALAPGMPHLDRPGPLTPIDLAALTNPPPPQVPTLDLAWLDSGLRDVLRRSTAPRS